MSRRRWLLAVLAVSLAAAALPLTGRALLRHWESNPVLRGRLLSHEQGCDSCHRPFGAKEIENPGSRWGTVPSFQSGNAFMYLRDRRDVEAIIRFGIPKSWQEHPNTEARLAQQRLRMPAYDQRLSDREISDLVALVRAEEPFELQDLPQVTAGRALARRLGCPSCHGPEGAGGHPNPGSLGGFIPGFLGKNYHHLVRDREEFAEWIRTGRVARLQTNPVVRFFWARQAISMPAYGDSLTEEEIESLWQWARAAQETFTAPPRQETSP